MQAVCDQSRNVDRCPIFTHQPKARSNGNRLRAVVIPSAPKVHIRGRKEFFLGKSGRHVDQHYFSHATWHSGGRCSASLSIVRSKDTPQRLSRGAGHHRVCFWFVMKGQGGAQQFRYNPPNAQKELRDNRAVGLEKEGHSDSETRMRLGDR